jgi:hypothetical protein
MGTLQERQFISKSTSSSLGFMYKEGSKEKTFPFGFLLAVTSCFYSLATKGIEV